MPDGTPPKAPDPTVEGRKTVRRRVLLAGKVIYNEGTFTVDCRIRDLSDGGARIILPVGQVIPTRVVLLDVRARIAYDAEVAWMKSPEIGLKFLGKYTLAGQLPPGLNYLRYFG